MNAKDPKVWAVAAAVVIALLLLVLLLGRGGSPPEPTPPGLPDKKGPSEVEVLELSGFEISVIRRKAAGILEIAWTVPALNAASFQVRRWDSASRAWITLGEPLSGSTRRQSDKEPKTAGTTYLYRVLAHAVDGTRYGSTYAEFLFEASEEPAKPQQLSGRWIGATVLLEWAPMRGVEFVVESDDRDKAEFVRENRYAHIPAKAGAPLTFRVSAIAESGQEGPAAELTISPPLSPIPVPERVSVAHKPGEPIAVSWSYPEGKPAAGFRVYNGADLLAELAGDARRWEDGLVSRAVTYRYAVEAVGTDGVLSFRAEAAPFRVEAPLEVLLPPPAGARVHWEREGNELKVRVSWDKPVAPARYQLERAGDPLRILRNDLPAEEGSHVFTPDSAGAVSLRLRALDPAGKAGHPAVLDLPAAKEFAPPARLGAYKVLEGERLQWTWSYPDLPMLKGYRIYLGADRLVGEDTLGREAKTWTTPPLTQKGNLAFTIEAVLLDGSVSARGPSREYYRPD